MKATLKVKGGKVIVSAQTAPATQQELFNEKKP